MEIEVGDYVMYDEESSQVGGIAPAFCVVTNIIRDGEQLKIFGIWRSSLEEAVIAHRDPVAAEGWMHFEKVKLVTAHFALEDILKFQIKQIMKDMGYEH